MASAHLLEQFFLGEIQRVCYISGRQKIPPSSWNLPKKQTLIPQCISKPGSFIYTGALSRHAKTYQFR